jgi:hypothetical protein
VNPDRLLLVGGGIVEGLGVTTHDLALGGQLARRISAITGRGVDLDIAARYKLTVRDAIELLRSFDLSRFDAIVLVVGIREVSGLMPRSLWAKEVTALLDWISENAPTGLKTFLVQIPNIADFIELPSWLGRQVRRHAGRLNTATDALARGRQTVSLVRFEPGTVEHPPRFSTSATYQRWGEVMAPDIARGLQRAPKAPRMPKLLDEEARQRALDQLHILDTPRDERFDRLVRMARDGLGVMGAQINFVDRQRTWTKAAASVSDEGVDRLHSFCARTILHSELFVVEDATRSPEFANFPDVTGDMHVRFYAGYPIESPDGQRVGALCVIDREPRSISAADAAILRELALRAEEVLWEIAEETAPAV